MKQDLHELNCPSLVMVTVGFTMPFTLLWRYQGLPSWKLNSAFVTPEALSTLSKEEGTPLLSVIAPYFLS